MNDYGTVQKTIYFVRHGESEDNTKPVVQSVNSPLSIRGQDQARVVAERLKHLRFDTLVTSSVPRAQQTAHAIALTTRKEAIVSDLFVERIKPTSTDGKSSHDPATKAIFDAWERSLYGDGERTEDGETFADITQRADAALQYLVDRPEHTLVVVTHGNFLRALIGRAVFGEELTAPMLHALKRHIAMENTGITTMLYRDTHHDKDFSWRLLTHNDRAHFAE